MSYFCPAKIIWMFLITLLLILSPVQAQDCLCGQLLIENATDANWSPDSSQIALKRFVDETFEIFVMDADGTNIRQLTDNQYDDTSPVWSPDGTKIAITRMMDDSSEIYVMNADGTDEIRLTDNTYYDSFPEWSLDGTQIIYRSDRGHHRRGYYPDVYLMNADGSGQMLLVPHTVESSASPDGTQIAYTYRNSIHIFDINSGEDINLHRRGSNLSWSPDSTQIAFLHNNVTVYELHIMTVDGSDDRMIADDIQLPSSLSWSPDGTRIVYISARDGTSEIYTINTDGTRSQRITNNCIMEQNVQLSPDGSSRVLYEDYSINGDSGIYLLNLNNEANTFCDCALENRVDVPPGDRIVLTALTEPGNTLFTMNENGITEVFSQAYPVQGVDLSPDGTQILYSPGHAIYIMPYDNPNESRILIQNAQFPSWSPDGTQIAYTSWDDFKIYIANADGSDVQRLEGQPPRNNFAPDWSPDGTQIAFVSWRGNEDNAEIFVSSVDGSGSSQLTDLNMFFMLPIGPQWSPDGSQIVFQYSSHRADGGGVYIMDAEGDNQHVLLEGIYGNPSWSPYGDVVITSWVTMRDIFLIEPDGSNLRQLTCGEYIYRTVSWISGGTG